MKAAFFDLDGTLTDNSSGILRCIAYALEQLGKPVPSDDVHRESIGPPLLPTFAKMLGNDLEAEQALTLYRERFSKVGVCRHS